MFKKCLFAVASATFGLGVSTAYAGTLSLQDATGESEYVGSTTAYLSNAEITTFGDDIWVSTPGAFGSNENGIVCGFAVAPGYCKAGFEINFTNGGVSNLRFSSFTWETGDIAQLEMYSGAELIFTYVITANVPMDFSFLADPITRIVFNDLGSQRSGIAFGNFLFEQEILGDNVLENPLPAALPMFLAGLAGMGYMQKRRKKNA